MKNQSLAYSRTQFVEQMRNIRFGNIPRKLSQPTLWRWLDLAGVARFQVLADGKRKQRKYFSQADFERVAIVAYGYRLGKTTLEIIEELNNYESLRSA